MRLYIQQLASNLILFLLLTTHFSSCNASTASHLASYEKAEFVLPSGESFQVFVAESMEQQTKGLSDIKNKDFPENHGMYFPGTHMQDRQFWMPKTYFNLDIIFMNEDFYILDIHRNLKRSPWDPSKRRPPFSKKVFSQHVLEIKADSPLSKKIKIGMILKLKKKDQTP